MTSAADEGAVEFQRQAADELEELGPPEEAKGEVERLIEALCERTEIFEQAIAVGRFFTPRRFDRSAQSGEKIDEAFEQLRNEGFLSKVKHDGDTS